LVGKPEGKRSLVRPGCIWENNIKKDLKEIIWEGVDRVLVLDRERWPAVMNAVMNIRPL
jgi:hypothetical protein